MNDADDEEFGFSRNYFLAKELGGSAVKSNSKLSDINIVDEQVFNSSLALIKFRCFLLKFETLECVYELGRN